MSYKVFKEYYLVEDYRTWDGAPKHTRLVKKYFYQYAKELKEEFGFDMRKCAICGIDDMWNGRPFMLELDHINRVTNDSRITNLRMLCPICHTQTDGYKNRSSSIEEYHKGFFCDA